MGKANIKQVPVYMLTDKHEIIKRLAGVKRESLTKWIEQAIDAKIKKEDK